MLQEILPSLEAKWLGCHVTGLRDLAAYIANTWDRVPVAKGIPLSVSGSHAGEFETSMMLATHPDLVRMEAAEAGNPAPFDAIAPAMMRDGIDCVSRNGVLGDQRAANAERGELYVDALSGYLAADLERARQRAEKARAS